jgi:RNA polymerase sigma factor (sigma-70 family)
MPVKESSRGVMAPSAAEHKRSRKSDCDLVHGCLQGRDEDWNLLIDKYKNLVFSIPIRYGLSREEAADIFQSVCLDLIQDLPKVKDPKALPKWLMQVASHKCFHWKRQRARIVSQDDEEIQVPEATVPADAELNLREIEEEQMLREARAGLPPRCQELIRMLFYEEPTWPYQQVAASLGLATGSIGLLRQKCLDRLRSALDAVGFS